TNAKPEISPFPFTTKTIIAGHINVDPYGKIVLIDTPGLLDRPLEEKKPIEYKAVLALKHLSDIVLYMFDINPNSYYTIDQQLNVYISIKKLLGDKEIIPVVNKIDITPNNLLLERINFLEKTIGRKPLPISAEKGINLEKLRKILIDKLMEKNQSP
ncbi:MAG: 50S ribosome-binding GTPase, partial [Staphylothermus sp.]|nr:50S ribosome-binding GTPase [Staphylothermus sp.]